jgi:DNA-binding response OmpR family regulator
MNTLLKQPEPVRPICEANPVPFLSEPTREVTAPEPRARILYVEDDPKLRRLGQWVLVESGYDVDIAADGMEGWDALQHAPYNLLITDYDLPRLTGMELIQQARLAGMRLPIVLATGSAHACDALASSSLGVAAQLPKPFGINALLETVQQVLRLANRNGASVEGMTSLAARFAHIQPFLHGGINE